MSSINMVEKIEQDIISLVGTIDKPISLKNLMANTHKPCIYSITGVVADDFPSAIKNSFNGSSDNINNKLTIEVFNFIYNGIVKTLSPYFNIRYCNLIYLGAYIPKTNELSLLDGAFFSTANYTSLGKGGGTYTDLGEISDNTTIPLPTYKSEGELYTYTFKAMKDNIKILISETVKWSFNPTIVQGRIYEYQFRYLYGVWCGGAVIYGE